MFLKCFKPCKDEISSPLQRQAESQIAETSGTVPDTDDNVGSHVIIFNLKNRIGTDDFRRSMVSQLKNATKEFTNEMKKSRLDSLKQAQLRLSQALKAGDALDKLKASLTRKMDKGLATHYQSGSAIVLSRSIADEVTVHIDKVRNSLCTIMEKFENNCDVQVVKESLPSLKQNFEKSSKLVTENIDSLNRSIKKLENDIKSIVDVLTNCHDYQETLNALSNLLEKNTNNCDPQFYLDLIGCDWSRHLRVMDSDINNGK